MATPAAPDDFVLAVRVSPRSSRNRFVLEDDGSLKVWLTAPPVDGVANRALLAFLGHILDLPPSSLKIVRGESSRSKRVRIPLAETDLKERLATAAQRRPAEPAKRPRLDSESTDY